MTTQPPPPGSAPHPYAPDRSSIQTNAIILLIAGVLCGGMIPAIFAIIALVQLDTDPASARSMNKIGWIILAILVGISLLIIVASILVPLIFGVALLPVIFGV